MKKFVGSVTAAFLLCGFLASTALGAGLTTAPGLDKLLCFDGTSDGGYYGLCTMRGSGARGPATLDNVSNDVTGATNPYDQYSGVYIESSTLNGALLADVSQLSFVYTGEATAGSPRISLPVDTTGDGLADGYLFISAYYCNNGGGVVDAINDPTCTIYTNFSGESFDNWADLVATHPTWTVATDALAFIIADDPGVWTVGGVRLGKGGK
jgi:hypothetical protein